MKLDYFLLKGNALTQNSKVIEFINERGSIFQRVIFLNAVGNNFMVAVARNKDEIAGVLPLVTTNKFGIEAAHIPPHTHIFGPIVSDNFYAQYDEIIYSLVSQLRITPLLEFKIELNQQDINPFNKLGANVVAVQTHVVSKVQKYNKDSIHSSKRRYLSKLLQALNEGSLILKTGRECHQDLLLLQIKTAKKSGFTPSMKALQSIMEALTDDQSYAVLICTPDGQPLAGAYCPFDTQYAYYVVNASINHSDNLFNRSNILATHLAITMAKERGLGFDFEGSNIPSIANYYRQMGGQPKMIYRIQIANNLIGKLAFAMKHFK